MDPRLVVEPQQGATDDQLVAVARLREELGFDAFFRSDNDLKMGDGAGLPGPSDDDLDHLRLLADTSL